MSARLLRVLTAAAILVSGTASYVYAEISAEDRAILEKIQKDSAQYFIRSSNKNTGLTKDSSRPGSPASIATTGFSLASMAIAQDRGWVPKDYAKKQIRKTLRHLLLKAEHKNGFFYHFLDPATGKRIWKSEASSIDTALLVAGALLAGEYFPGTDIQKMAKKIYERIDWAWMMNKSPLMCMGWVPETGFLPYYWDSYNELLILQALALGSPTFPISPEAWNAWDRNEDTFNNRKVVYAHSGSLFTYQYSHAFIDFRELDDRGINYFENSIQATLANRDYSMSFAGQHKSYTENSWGLSASEGPGGYKAYGAKPGLGLHDGTIAPYAAISSIVFTPEESLKAVRFFYENYQENLYGIFGFKDAFNLDKKWWSQDYIGIDQGISVLMLENFLNEGIIWKKFMGLSAVQNWIKTSGLKKEAIPSA